MPDYHTVIRTPLGVEDVTNILSELPKDQPTIYLCLEDTELDEGSAPPLLSILVNYPAGVHHFYYIHIRVLSPDVSEIRGTNHLTLRDILQRSDIPKIVFNAPRIARTLYLQYEISVRGVLYLQHMGNITRTTS